MKKLSVVINFCLGFLLLSPALSYADGIVSEVVSAPVFANGILRDERSGINIYLQNDQVRGLDFMDPKVEGYGIPPGGSMEVEMISGFQRDASLALDDKSLLLTVGAPQQGLPDDATNHTISQGENENTFLIKPTDPLGLQPDKLVSPAPGARLDTIPARGIKIVHVGRVSAFVSRGETGVVEVRIKDKGGNVIAKGRGSVNFLAEPAPQIFLTNIPHNQRNHNWQRVGAGQVVGAARKTMPLALLLFDRNQGLGKTGLNDVGVLSKQQLVQAEVQMPSLSAENFSGVIVRDTNKDGVLDPKTDQIVGIVQTEAPVGTSGDQVLTPLVNEKPFLSVDTGQFNERAGKAVGGSIMQVVFIAGDKTGVYRLSFSMLKDAGNLESELSPPAVYSVVVE